MANILVIDDEPLVREVLELRLTDAGHQVKTARDGLKGLACYNRGSVDLVITDIFMPEKDGLETIMELRAVNPDMKIIAISGGSRVCNADFLEIARKLGASAVFAKPFEYEKILKTIEDCLTGRIAPNAFQIAG